jgi:hypothetical protein
MSPLWRFECAVGRPYQAKIFNQTKIASPGVYIDRWAEIGCTRRAGILPASYGGFQLRVTCAQDASKTSRQDACPAAQNNFAPF